MAEKIVGFRLKLEGEKATIDTLNTVRESLNQSSRALDNINKKSDTLDKLTKHILTLTKALQGLENDKSSDKQAEKVTKYRTELEKTVKAQNELLKELQQTGGKGSEQYDELLKSVAKNRSEQSELTKAIKTQQKEFEGVKVAVGSYRQLDLQLQLLSEKYKQLSRAERQAETGKATLKNIKDLENELKSIDASMGRYTRNVGNYASAFNGLKTITQQLAGVIGITTGLNEILESNTKQSDSLANIQRVSTLTDESVKKLYESLKQINTRTLTDELLSIAVIGGKLGESEKDLANFVQAADKIGVALKEDLGGNIETTLESLGVLVNIFGKDLPKNAQTTGDKMLYVGNAIDTLSDAGTASGDFIVDFSKRLAGMNDVTGFTLPRILGLAAAFQQNGQTAEVSATATQSLITTIAAAPDEFARLAGFTGKAKDEFINLINSNPVEALLQLASTLKGNNPLLTQFSGALKDAGVDGERAKSVLSVLGSKTDEFRESIDLASTSIETQTKITSSYEVANKTAGAALDRLKKSIIDATTSTEFQSWLFGVIEGLTKFTQILFALPKFVANNKIEVVALGLAYLALNQTLIETSKTKLKALFVDQVLENGTKQLAATTRIYNAVLAATPWLVAIAAVYGLVKGYQYLNSEITASKVANDALKDVQKQVNAEAVKEVSQLNKNIATLKSDKTSREAKKLAIDELIAQNPEYLKGIDLEKASIEKLTAIQNDLTKSILKTAAVRLRDKLTGEISDKAVENRFRIDEIATGGSLTESEYFKASNIVKGSKPNTTNFGGQLASNNEIAAAAIELKKKEGIEYEKAIEVINSKINKMYDLSDQKAVKSGNTAKNVANGIIGTGETITKADEKRRAKAARDLKKEEDDRIKDEKAAAENIFRIRQQLIDKTFNGQKLAAIAERNEQVKALKGSTEQVAEQKKLLDELLQKRLETINDGYQAERDAALRDIAAQRQEFLLRQANNTVSNIQSSGRAQNRVFELDAINTEGVFTGKEQQILQTTKTEKEKTELLKKLGIEREKALIEIEERKFQYNKDLASRELAAQKLALDEKKANDLLNLDETERESRAKLDESLRAKLLTVEEYNTALDELTAQTEAERAQIEIENSDAYSELAAQTAIDVLATETDIANQKLQIAKDTNEQILENAKKTKDNEQAIQAARLDFLSTFVNGAKDLLGQDENTRKKYSGVIKALALAEIAINLQRELSAIAVAAAANPTNAVTFGGAGITQYTIQSGIAILRAAFGTAKVLTAKYEDGGVIAEHNSGQVQGGSIPSESGVIRGRSHAQGGVKLGNLEFEGDEYKLRNGNETYIINKNATRQHRSALDTLAKILRPSVFSSQRKQIASHINASNGGVKFAQGGVLSEGSVFNTPLIGAPLPVQSSNVVVVNNSNQTVGELTELIYETQNMILAVNSRIDRITVINKPEEVYNEAIKQKEIRVAQNL